MILPHQERFHLTFQMNFQSFRLTPQLFGSKSYPPLFRNAGGKKRKFWAGREPRNNWQPTHPPHFLRRARFKQLKTKQQTKKTNSKTLDCSSGCLLFWLFKQKQASNSRTYRGRLNCPSNQEELPSYGKKLDFRVTDGRRGEALE